jgi:L-ascorbate metabolism protein UlaG (beta-lactamase superfamily)
METVAITNPGIGATIITAGSKRILIDACNTMIDAPQVLPGDIILFTHDDGDHFSADMLPDLRGTDMTIVGPPTILKPILSGKKADIDQVEVMYSNRDSEPASITVGEASLTCYHTGHFNHWDPIHNSYLIEVGGKRIFVTGDSEWTRTLADAVGKTDAIVANLVDEDFLKGRSESAGAISRTINYLRSIVSGSTTGQVIGVHLQLFPWTVSAEALAKAVDDAGLLGVVIPIAPDQRIEI